MQPIITTTCYLMLVFHLSACSTAGRIEHDNASPQEELDFEAKPDEEFFSEQGSMENMGFEPEWIGHEDGGTQPELQQHEELVFVEPNPPPVVASWVYQLSNYQNNCLDQIASSGFDLAVVDLARDGSEDFFTSSELAAVKATQKIVLAYFEIGAIEDYRPEWDLVPEDLKLGPVSGWPGEQYVKYWDERWWPIVKGRVDQALSAGFDGAYLDMIVTYEEIPANSAGTNRDDLAQKMVDLISKLSLYAKTERPGFMVFPQNSPELHSFSSYLTAIDGLGMEEMYYQATDRPCSQSWCAENRANATVVSQAGKLVLSIDYADISDNIADAYTRSRQAAFVPYVSNRDLSSMRINQGWDPDP